MDRKDLLEKYINYLSKNERPYPISSLDYSSLYPSLIMTYNLSPEYLIRNEEKKVELEKKGYPIHSINFNYDYLNYMGEQCSKTITGWTIRHDESLEENTRVGLYPTILKNLFEQRAEMKKNLFIYDEKKEHMEKYTDDYINNLEYIDCLFKLKYYDTKQKTLKVFMNIFYGELGNKNSPLFILELAGGITSAGQNNLLKVKNLVESLDHEVYYGDSVTKDTPIMIKKNNIIQLLQIENIVHTYDEYNDNKEINCLNEYIEVMTENGWTKIKKVIRHYTTKKIYRITTHVGSVNVTEDHSLLNENKEKITPSECKLGTNLLHWDSKYNTRKICKIKNIHRDILNTNYYNIIVNNSKSIAFVWGFFFGDGSCGYYNCKSGKKYSFALNNFNKYYLQLCIDIFKNNNTDVNLKIIDTLESSKVYKAIAIGNVKKLVLEYRKLFYSTDKLKIVPEFILNADNETKLLFLQGYYLADGDTEYGRLDCKGQIGSQGLYLLLNDLNYNVSVNVKNDKQNMYRISFTYNKFRKNPNCIKKIEYLGTTTDFVYDLETETHHFAAGVGRLVVHNTDSLYISCPPRNYLSLDKQYYTNCINKEKYCTELVNITFTAIDNIKNKVNIHLYQDNGTKYLKMAYEEVLYPVIFLAKKKYYGIAHKKLPNFKPKDMFIRGLEVKKRGVSELLKINCNQIMWESLDIYNKKTLRDLVINKIEYIFTKKWDLCDFIQTGLWKPNKCNITLNKFVDRMKKEGKQIPEPYERFNYVLLKIDDPRKLYDVKGNKIAIGKSDKMEYVEFATQCNKDIDLKYYFDKQLIGQFARLISYDTEFHVYSYVDDVLEFNDDKTLTNGKKYLSNIASNYTGEINNYGKLYKEIYRTINKKYKEKKTKNLKVNKRFDILFNSQIENAPLEEMVINNVDAYLVNKNISEEANNIIKSIKNTSEDIISKIYNNKPDSYYSKQMRELNINLSTYLTEFINTVKEYNLEDMIFNVSDICVISIITNIREKYNIDDKCKNNKITSITDIISNEELDQEINEVNEPINVDILTDVYNKYINIISIKKNILLLNEIQNIYYNSIYNKQGYLNKPNNFIL